MVFVLYLFVGQLKRQTMEWIKVSKATKDIIKENQGCCTKKWKENAKVLKKIVFGM